RSYGDWSSDVCSSDLISRTAVSFLARVKRATGATRLRPMRISDALQSLDDVVVPTFLHVRQHDVSPALRQVWRSVQADPRPDFKTWRPPPVMAPQGRQTFEAVPRF